MSAHAHPGVLRAPVAMYPAMHEAVGVVESSQFRPGTVAEELQRGYRWDDELLRPARVRVAQ